MHPTDCGEMRSNGQGDRPRKLRPIACSEVCFESGRDGDVQSQVDHAMWPHQLGCGVPDAQTLLRSRDFKHGGDGHKQGECVRASVQISVYGASHEVLSQTSNARCDAVASTCHGVETPRGGERANIPDRREWQGARIMQILNSVSLEMAMMPRASRTVTLSEVCVGQGLGATGRLAYQDDQYLFGCVAELERGLPVLNDVLARDGHRLRLDKCSGWTPALDAVVQGTLTRRPVSHS